MTTFGAPSLLVEYDRQIRAELEDGESLLWAGQPQPIRLALQTLPILIFGLFFGGFAVFWVAMAMGIGSHASHGEPPSGPMVLFPFFGAPFILIGVIMIASPFMAYMNAKKMIYAVTDRRAMILSQGMTRTVKSYHARDIEAIQRSDRADGTGDVIFAHTFGTDSRGNRTTTSVGFLGVPQPRDVEALIQKLVDDHGEKDTATTPISLR